MALGEAGATVYVTVRNVTDKDVKEITTASGNGVAVLCNHEKDREVKKVFKLINK